MGVWRSASGVCESVNKVASNIYLTNNSFVMNISLLNTGDIWREDRRLPSTPDAATFDSPDLTTLRQALSLGTPVHFRGRLDIPGLPSIPEQVFTISSSGNCLKLENDPEGSWPEILIELESDPPQGKVKKFLVRPSNNRVDGELLRTRFIFSLAKANEVSLYNEMNEELLKIRGDFASSLDEPNLLYRVRLYRKLKYIEKVFGVNFSLPDIISGEQVMRVETIFRGITEGEFAIRGEQIIIPTLSCPPDTDLSKPPFYGSGEFSFRIESPALLLDQPLQVGPITVLLKQATLANPKVIDQIQEGRRQLSQIHFELLDNQILYRFEVYVQQPAPQLMQQLDRFKQELACEEPKELVDRVSESLQSDVSSYEAFKIAVGWSQCNDLPDRFCPQEPELDQATGHWRVPICLMYNGSEGGEVGEVVIDIKTGKIIEETSIEELYSRGLALSEQLLHAR